MAKQKKPITSYVVYCSKRHLPFGQTYESMPYTRIESAMADKTTHDFLFGHNAEIHVNLRRAIKAKTKD